MPIQFNTLTVVGIEGEPGKRVVIVVAGVTAFNGKYAEYLISEIAFNNGSVSS
jgi:hypothetical protein